MSDQAIREAAGHITGAANMIERTAAEVLVAFREGRFDPEPVGSPAYVRRYRDETAARLLASIYANPHQDRFAFKEVREARGHCIDQANALVAALGYQVPRDGEVKS